jgi:hypothetical protein
MAQTFTSTAYAAVPKKIHAGMNVVSFDYTTAAGVSLSASANSAVLLGPKIPNQATIHQVLLRVSSGAATCPVDVGYDDTISALASQFAQSAGTAIPTGLQVPQKISITSSTDQGYATMKLGITPGTDTAVVRVQCSVYYTFDQQS